MVSKGREPHRGSGSDSRYSSDSVTVVTVTPPVVSKGGETHAVAVTVTAGVAVTLTVTPPPVVSKEGSHTQWQ